ncbi:MAG: hypothetical protein MJ188_05015 [Treponema sp.]|nr:hypothetical protein [Treponema sp.]
MGREIEIKIPLSKEQFSDLYEKLVVCKNLTSIDGKESSFFSGITVVSVDEGLILKKDEYYSKYKTRDERIQAKEPQCIRVRTEGTIKAGENASCAGGNTACSGGNTRSFFTLKRKSMENGTEFNQENETFVEDVEVLRDFFAVAGYCQWFYKEKKAYSVHCESSALPGVDFHLELETVNDLPYVEIEVLDEDACAQSVRASLEVFVKQLKLNPENRDSRSWVSIIEQS